MSRYPKKRHGPRRARTAHLLACVAVLPPRTLAVWERQRAQGHAVCRRLGRHRWVTVAAWPVCLRCGGAMSAAAWMARVRALVARGLA